MNYVPLLALVGGSAIPVVLSALIVYRFGTSKKYWRSFVYAGWISLALYGLGSREAYSLTAAGIYLLIAAVGALIGLVIDMRKPKTLAIS